jgi:hypothetical protein
MTPGIAETFLRCSELSGRALHFSKIAINAFPPTALSSPQAQREVLEVLRLLEPRAVVGFRKTRVGSPGDGGYVQIDDVAGVTRALSFGVADNDAWDLGMAARSVPVEQFDGTITDAPSRHPLLRFHKKMIEVATSRTSACLPDLVSQFSCSDSADLILKMDIEGCEWEVLDAAPEHSLGKFTQLIVECHSLSQLENPRFRARAKRVFEKLARSFAVVHVHGNNYRRICSVANVPLPEVLEVTFASRARYRFTENRDTFPTPLDAPCCPGLADIALGLFRF